ncbi:MAG: hypothetical protein WKG01_10480 [Kofleriaceae bacterium]
MSPRWIALAALAGCSFKPGSGTSDGSAPTGDGSLGDATIVDIDGTIEDAPAVTCADFMPRANPQHVEPCDVLPGGAWTVSSLLGIYNTDDGTYAGGADPMSYEVGDYRVVSVSAFTVSQGATLRLIGSRPLVVVAWDTIAIAGVIDVSSIRSDNFMIDGAGANPGDDACNAAGAGESSQDSGGGGGGGFGASGGAGGDGKGGNTNNEGGAAGTMVAVPVVVRGGCPGGDGGTGSSRGRAGSGGGGLQLTAKTSITITGRITAGGAGGDGGHGDGGGGGGGAGGYLGFDAPSVQLRSGSIVAANGGGGGTGCDGGTGSDGRNGGLDADPAAGGGENATLCAKPEGGGDGGAGTKLTGENGSDSPGDSAGGAGGAVGYVLVWSSSLMAQGLVSPAIMQR